MNNFLTDDRTKIVYFGAPHKDGSRNRFHLAGHGMGKEGVLLGVDPSELEFPPEEILWSEGARQDGASYLDTIISKRELDLKFLISGPDKREFRRRRELWFRSWSASTPGQLGCYTRYNGWRWLGVQRSGPPQPLWGKDPALIRAADYDMDLVAADPLWHSFQEKYLWVNEGLTGRGKLKIRNASDYKVFPQYYMPGPGTYSIQDGDGGDLITFPKLVAGETLSIDTHPRRPFARIFQTGTGIVTRNALKEMRGRRLRQPMDEWSTTELDVTVTGGNYASAIYSVAAPRFASPW
nr:hypothetical protein [Rhodococcus sp. (in: high G+C Gram-positive bacteria)]